MKRIKKITELNVGDIFIQKRKSSYGEIVHKSVVIKKQHLNTRKVRIVVFTITNKGFFLNKNDLNYIDYAIGIGNDEFWKIND